MRIAITGSTGLVGDNVVAYFKENGSDVTRIVRPSTKKSFDEPVIHWDIKKQILKEDDLEGFDAVIHLAGANISDKRWTGQYKKVILNSRIDSTRLLCKALSQLKNPPKVLLSASAIGIYGPCESHVSVDEDTSAGRDFLADVCRRWEEATEKAEQAGIRTIHLRLGAVLSQRGGALGKMLPIFKLGLGGKLGSGEQMFSWIAVEEIPQILMYLINNHEISGAVNLVAPNPVSNAVFTKCLGDALKRPAIFPVPGFGVRCLFGEMADAILLGGAKVYPKRLKEHGYSFKYPDLKPALEACLN